jgi:leader peptidase (prepilin peptidase)/N-methyltransferase
MLNDDPLFLAAALAWLFVVGSTVGSFLNVVVYRLPAGLSLLFPSSHCPACKTPIRLRDNLPIFGWLILRGRCRDCRVHISARYPLVELATALIFVVLAWFEPLSNAMNLPWVGMLRAQPAVGQHPLGMTGLWVIYAFHLLLLCSLLAAALIEYDGCRLPRRFVIFTLLVGFIAPIVWPWLRPMSTHFATPGFVGRLIDGVWDLVFAAALGFFIYRATGRGNNGKTAAVCPYVVLMWAGVFLGERGCLDPTAITAVVFLVAMLLARYWPALERIPWSGWFGAAVFVWLIKWRTIDGMLPEVTSEWELHVFSAALLLILGLSFLAGKVRIGNFHRRCGM